jgi:thiol-disulfide isomerase/thioredoxin
VAKTNRDLTKPTQSARQLIEVQRRQAQKRSNMIRAGIVFIAVLAVIGIGIGVAVSRNSSPSKAAPASVAPSALVNQVTNMSPAELDKIGKGSGNTPPTALTGNPVTTADGKPVVLYVGGEFCPYCAAERWAMLAAFGRFGTFSNVSEIYSVEDNIPTFSFHDSTYTSNYVTFQPVEVNGNALNAAHTGYVPLETLTAAQQATFTKLNPQGSFPFMDFAGQASVIGSSYSPTLLQGKTQQQVADALADPTTDIAKAIGGTANAFTAQICKLTNNQPANVCSTAAVKAFNGG